MNRCAVIGFGNPLRQDDGMGWRAAELAEAGLKAGLNAALKEDTVEISICHQLTPELVTKLEHAPLVIFLDAAADQAPGEVTQRLVEPDRQFVGSHSLTPGQLLGLAQLVYGSSPPAVLISGGASEMNSGDSMTRTGELCAAQMAQLTLDLLIPLAFPESQT